MKKFIVEVVYEGHSGKEYTEQLKFIKEKEAQKVYCYFADDKSGCVRSVMYKTIEE